MLENPMFSKWVIKAKAKNGGNTTRLKKTREMILMNPNFIAFFSLQLLNKLWLHQRRGSASKSKSFACKS